MSYNSLLGFGSHSKDSRLVSHWNGDANLDFTGDVNDRVGFRNGTWVGSSAYGTAKFGSGKSITFSGGTYFTADGLLASTTFPSGKYTLACWFKAGASQTTWASFIKQWIDPPGRIIHFGKNGGTNAIENYWCQSSGSQYGPATAGSGTFDGTWHHAATVADGSYVTSYVDGTAGTPYSYNGTLHSTSASTGKLWIGNSYHNSGQYLAGDLFDIAIFDNSLSTGELSELKSGPEPLNTAVPTLTISSTTFSGTVGTWNAQSNGTLTYVWELRDSDDDSVIASGSTSTISGSGSYSGNYYLWVRSSNDGGYDSAADSVSATQSASPTFNPAWARNVNQVIAL